MLGTALVFRKQFGGLFSGLGKTTEAVGDIAGTLSTAVHEAYDVIKPAGTIRVVKKAGKTIKNRLKPDGTVRAGKKAWKTVKSIF